ncbi:hypothetical protein [Robertmurraya kyonggiensis]|uniref:hypothetical protein n=1 Tax=Robertmurraya kyonggiensis TaxID=1037680 RepID=UPI001FE4759C|nr:hypothetical protein [Robertmurraya kyonggiensis]
MEKKTSIFIATHGVMTNVVDVISRKLELSTTCDDNGAITYVGAEEWYTLPGKDYHDPLDHEVVHRMPRHRARALLRRTDLAAFLIVQ